MIQDKQITHYTSQHEFLIPATMVASDNLTYYCQIAAHAFWWQTAQQALDEDIRSVSSAVYLSSKIDEVAGIVPDLNSTVC